MKTRTMLIILTLAIVLTVLVAVVGNVGASETVPDVTGMTVENAIATLTSGGFDYDKIHVHPGNMDKTDPAVLALVVTKQEPKEGTTDEGLNAMNLWARDAEDIPTPCPTVTVTETGTPIPGPTVTVTATPIPDDPCIEGYHWWMDSCPPASCTLTNTGSGVMPLGVTYPHKVWVKVSPNVTKVWFRQGSVRHFKWVRVPVNGKGFVMKTKCSAYRLNYIKGRVDLWVYTAKPSN